MDKREFAQAIAPVAEYYGRNLTDAAVAVYYRAAKHLDLELFEHLLEQHISDPAQGKFFPQFAHLLDQAGNEEDVARQAAIAFDHNPKIDGTGWFDANQESKAQTDARRKRYIALQIERWKKSTPLKRLADSPRLPESLRISAEKALEHSPNLKLEARNG